MLGKKKTATGLKTLTPNKLLTTLPILLSQINARNNHTNLKMKSDRYCIFCNSILKSPETFTTT